MHDAHSFLQNLAIVLCVAAVTTVVFHRLRQPVVFGYLLAGMIVGPHIPIPLVVDKGTVETLSEMGVILLMFALGLEFSLRKLIQVAPTAGLIALAQSSAMVWLGYGIAQLFGWTTMESIYAGAIIAISSTTIIAKAFEEQKVRGRFTQVVIGVLIIEDLIAIFLLAILTAVSAGSEITATSLGVTGVRLATFLALLTGGGLLLVPRIIRHVVKVGQPETTLIVSIGICFAAALLALSFGYSVALGAFIAGSLVAESGEEKTIEHLVRPVRDVFAAIFFVAVGMMLDPGVVLEYWLPVVVFTLVVIVGKITAVTISSFLTGYSPRSSVQAGMSLAQIGEFSFIIAGVGLASGATRPFLYPVAVAVSALTTLTTPWLIRAATPVATWVDRKLPHRLQTFAALHGSWMDQLRGSKGSGAERSRAKRLTRLVALDAFVLCAVIIGVSLEFERLATLLHDLSGLSEQVGRLVVIGLTAVVAVPLIIGLVHTARLLGLELAKRAMPQEGRVDFAAAPRRSLVVTLQLGIITLVAIPVMAVTQPFLPPFRLAAALAALLLILGIAFWRSAANLHGHARAGAQVIVAALANQMATEAEKPEELKMSVDQMHKLLPGLGEPVPIRVSPLSAVRGQSLAGMNLRGITGATVLAILRDGEPVVAPTGGERANPGDVLVCAGSEEAIEAARSLLATAGDSADGQ